MAKQKKLNMNKFKSSMKRTTADHKDWKVRIKNAIDSGEHKTADTAIKILSKSRDALHKMLEQVEGHSTKKKAKSERV